MRFQNILVPTDLSESSLAVIDKAASLARRFQAKVHLFHVVEDVPIVAYGPMEGVYLDLDQYQTEARKRSSETLAQRAAAQSEELGITIESEVQVGNASERIVARAAELPDALICLSNQGRTGLSGALIGSIAERVVRNSEVPVLTVSSRVAPGPLHVGRILCATDVSESSLAELPRAAEFAKELEAIVDYLYVVDDSAAFYMVNLALYPMVSPEHYQEHSHGEARKILRTELENRVALKDPERLVIREGVPYEQIVKEAEEGPYDLVVVASHGRRGFQRMILGSVTEKVVRHAATPVLTLPMRDR